MKVICLASSGASFVELVLVGDRGGDSSDVPNARVKCTVCENMWIRKCQKTVRSALTLCA
jgi:hypothetical protein